MTNINLPILPEQGLSSYIAKVQSFPMLSEEEEQSLANKWVENEDVSAAHNLVTSHLRLVVKIASGYKGYGLPMQELIGEGNIGLMTAVKKFDPTKGFRLSTYAMWWIKAQIHEYILRSWSIVKVGSSAVQKKLFFNLKRLKNKIAGTEAKSLSLAEAKEIAKTLEVKPEEVLEMDELQNGGAVSINKTYGDEDSDNEFGDYLTNDAPSQEEVLGETQVKLLQSEQLRTAMNDLKDREKDILIKRKLIEPAKTLEELSEVYKISKERVRQIESAAFLKLQKALLPA